VLCCGLEGRQRGRHSLHIKRKPRPEPLRPSPKSKVISQNIPSQPPQNSAMFISTTLHVAAYLQHTQDTTISMAWSTAQSYSLFSYYIWSIPSILHCSIKSVLPDCRSCCCKHVVDRFSSLIFTYVYLPTTQIERLSNTG